MENEPQNKDERPPSGDADAAAAKEAAEKAAAQAKEAASTAAKMFKSMDLHSQIYLGGLAVMVLLVMVFDTYHSSSSGSFGRTSAGVSIFNMGFWGPLAFLGGLAGVGIFIWDKIASPGMAWIPLAVAGAAGIAVLCFLIIWIQSRGAGGSVSFGDTKIKAGLTFFGFYLPFLCAIAATAVSVMRIVKA